MFTLSEISFGMCFLHRAEMTPKTETVTITNEDNTDIRSEKSKLWGAPFKISCDAVFIPTF